MPVVKHKLISFGEVFIVAKIFYQFHYLFAILKCSSLYFSLCSIPALLVIFNFIFDRPVPVGKLLKFIQCSYCFHVSYLSLIWSQVS